VSCLLPSQYAVDYDVVLSSARAEGVIDVARFLQEQLPLHWRDAYLKTVGHETNLVRFRHRTFDYICDLYSQLEFSGEVPFNQTIADRVVAVIGTSSEADATREPGRMRGWAAPTEEFLDGVRDKGHFMAHCIGGGLDVNVFAQERNLNRGWSAQGKIYRQMENYCYEQLGTLCFSRPIYADGSNVPRWLEFGCLKTDETLWVEVFDN